MEKTVGWLRRFIKDISKHKITYLLAIPVIAYYIVFCYLPMYGIVIAFKDFSIRQGIMESPWADMNGFAHIINFVKGPYFIRVVSNTLLISFYEILFGFPAPIIFALLLNELRGERFKKTVQTVTYLPHFISIMVACGMITMFVGSDGIICNIVTFFGGSGENLLYNPSLFKPIYVISGMWQEIGWGSIVYLSALTNVDNALYEAAEIDGANRFKKMISITIPCIMPTIITLFILRVGSIMSIGYEKVLLLQNPLNMETSDVISSFVYRRGIEDADYSFSTAVGLINSVVNMIVLLTTNYICKKAGETSLW